MNSPTAILVAAATAILTPAHGAAAGSIYACRDLSGRAHSADRPVTECAQTAMRELRSDGAIRREIEAPLSGEQLRRQQAEELKRQSEHAARREQQLRDRALLMTYPTESALEQAQARETARLQREIDSSVQRILAFERDSKAVKARIDPSRKSTPETLQQEIAQIASEILTEDAIMRLKREQMARSQARFDEIRKRLRELLDAKNVWALQTTDRQF